MSLVLVVEDDAAIREGLMESLRTENHDVLVAADGETGYRLAREARPELVILDLMLPRMGGFEICRKLRAEGIGVPILMLTARSEESDRVLGLDLGADDYVTKPFSVRELLARVRALLRRASDTEKKDKKDTAEKGPDHRRFDDIVVDFRRFEVSRRGTPVELTRKEFAVLRMLGAKAGEAVTREDLLNGVWGYQSYPNTRTVDTHIFGLRAKLEQNPSAPRRLITVHGIGYKLVIS